MPVAPHEFPERLGRYRLVRPISKGGMARVYEARRESLAGVAPKVAIKVILPEHEGDALFQQLFVNEARIGSQLQHQNLVQIQDFDRQDGCFYLVMEYVEGVTLRRAVSLCRRHGIQIPLAVVAEVGRQVCEGLHYAHTARSDDGHPLHLVHRDIKPSNLILNPQGVVKVLDFGISKAVIAAEKKGSVKGTWGYMSPEQAAEVEVHAPADQYGVASVLYEMAALASLFPEKDSRQLRQLMNDDEGARRANRLAGPLGPLVPVLLRALQRDPAARFASAMVMAQSLGRLVPDPVRAREQLLHFQQTVTHLAAGQHPPTGPRSSSTMHAASQGTRPPSHPSQPSQGLPVGVGSVQHPYQAPIDPPPRARAPQRSPWTTGALFMAGLCLLALAFAGFALLKDQIFPTESSLVAAVEEAPVKQPPQGLAPALAELEEPEPELDEPEPEPVVEPSPVSKPKITPKAPKVRVQPATAPATEPEVVEPEPAPAPAVKKTAGGIGLLTVSSLPQSKVIVDGQFIRKTPLFEYELPAGAHTIRLETDDGQYTRFKVDVTAGQTVRRIWHFEQGAWVEN